MDINFSIIALALLGFFVFLAIKLPGTALIGYIPFCFLLLFFSKLSDEAGLHNSQISFMACAIIIFFITPLCVWLWGGDQFKDHWKRKMGKVIFITVIMLGGVALCFPAMISMVGVYFLFFMAFIIVSIRGVVKSTKRATLGFVMTTIGASLRQNLPLTAALRSAAEGQPFGRKMPLLNISNWLEQGFSLADSIKRGYRKCPPRITALIEQAEKMSQLPQTLASIEKDIVQRSEETRHAGPIKPLSYILTVFIAANLILFGLMLFVMPKFAEVLYEMTGGDLPLSTQIVMSYANFMTFKYGWAWVMLIITLFGLGSLLNLRTKFSRRRPVKPRLSWAVKDWFRWHTPIIRWYEINYSALNLVELLKSSVSAGIPILQAFKQSTELDVNICFRKKLVKLFRILENGGDTSGSIVQCKLPKPIAWAFQSNPDQDSLSDMLEMIENFYRTNYSYMVSMAKFVLTPLSIILLGAGVGFVCYAVLSPMVQIIEHLIDVTP